MIKIRIDDRDCSELGSGISRYTKLLKVYLSKNPKIKLSNFPKTAFRLQRKLNSYGLLPATDSRLAKVDLVIYPNFAYWPTVNSKLVATVIHDLTYINYSECVESKNLAHLRRVVPKAVKKSDYIITISNSIKNEIKKQFNVDESKFILTPIPPDEVFYKKLNREVHDKYKIPTKKYILFVGNLEPRKNLSTLIKAYRLMPKKIRDEYSLIIGGGKGWKFEETEKLLKNGPKDENIRRIGFIDQKDLPALYQKASCFVMPSHYEGFGIPILEALASGCPVVVSDIPVFHETGGSAINYANPNSPESFSREIMKTLNNGFNPAKATEHLKKFSWEKNIQTIIEKIQEDNL